MKRTFVYDHYYLYAEIAEKLKKYAADYPRYTKLDCLGITPAGRETLLIEVTDTAAGDFADKPAYYVEGNIHAGEVTGSMAIMAFLDTIFSNLEDAGIRSMLEKYTLYLLPRVSVDGSEYYLTTPDSVRSIPRYFPYEQKLPGLQPMDIDGDGVIRAMRVKTPYGIWKKSPADPRLMVRREPDEDEGEFYNVYQEGEILGYDGLGVIPAPEKFSYDNNRNYPYAWVPQWEQRGGGETPFANPEVRFNTAFLQAHRNIGSVLDMHTSGGMVLFTPGHKSEAEADPQDMAIYRELCRLCTEESGFPALNVCDGLMKTYGGFDDFCHYGLGIPAVTIECWDWEARAGVPLKYPYFKAPTEQERQEKERRLLKWMDENLTEEEGFLNWKPFEHPQLGPVEIGGYSVKYVSQNPPVKFLEEEIDKHVRYMLRAVKTLARLSFDELKLTKLSEGIYKLRVVVGNRGFMPTYSFNEGKKNPLVKEISVSISGEAELIQGSAVTTLGHLEGFSKVESMSRFVPTITVEKGPRRAAAEYILQGKAGTELTLTAEGGHCGRITAKLTLE